MNDQEGATDEEEETARQLGRASTQKRVNLLGRKAREATGRSESQDEAAVDDVFVDVPPENMPSTSDASELDAFGGLGRDDLCQRLMEFLAEPVLLARAEQYQFEVDGGWVCPKCKAFTHRPERVGKKFDSQGHRDRHLATHSEWGDLEVKMLRPNDQCTFGCPSCPFQADSIGDVRDHCLTSCDNVSIYTAMYDASEPRRPNNRRNTTKKAKSSKKAKGKRKAVDADSDPNDGEGSWSADDNKEYEPPVHDDPKDDAKDWAEVHQVREIARGMASLDVSEVVRMAAKMGVHFDDEDTEVLRRLLDVCSAEERAMLGTHESWLSLDDVLELANCESDSTSDTESESGDDE
ncbi:hypothetical protein JAAARDRAFT_60836 [Jaapia argillacea MUCL 33604]|uniref:C2H2-type domain-containing protein n=1 Tax=Jaapia argillacea MUCL 33604 TaxID=933084 RepID=A0A067PGL0_9AGAM|nr:hypothetical protein JAAARDRAFT_60836 [Jaapia argillacea MUCL 33604]